MNSRAVGKRIAVDFDALDLPFGTDRALELLQRRGFTVLETRPVSEARSLIGVAQYEYLAKPDEAPAQVNCSSFVRWVYGQCGIWIPRRTIQQFQDLHPVTEADDIVAGDLLFWTGKGRWYVEYPEITIGYVSIATDEGTMVHASQRVHAVVETPIDGTRRTFRGARRVFPTDRTITLLQVPNRTFIETHDDMRWYLLQRDHHESHRPADT